jgi:hypothetical protein
MSAETVNFAALPTVPEMRRGTPHRIDCGQPSFSSARHSAKIAPFIEDAVKSRPFHCVVAVSKPEGHAETAKMSGGVVPADGALGSTAIRTPGEA